MKRANDATRLEERQCKQAPCVTLMHVRVEVYEGTGNEDLVLLWAKHFEATRKERCKSVFNALCRAAGSKARYKLFAMHYDKYISRSRRGGDAPADGEPRPQLREPS